MQTNKQQTVTQFLNKQAKANKQHGLLDFAVNAVQWLIIVTPMVIAFAGFFGAFDAIVK